MLCLSLVVMRCQPLRRALDLLEVFMDHFELLKQQLEVLKGLSDRTDEIGYFAEEALRFYSIAGTLKDSDLLKNKSAEERQISHILGRSLLEGYFWLIYIFDEPAQRKARFDEKVHAFKREYGKYWNELLASSKKQMESADPSWTSLSKPKDLNSMLSQIKNDKGDKLSYLYSVYRAASFDTHGNSMDALFRTVFGKRCNFSFLDFNYGFDLMANQYLVILQELQSRQEI
ncbi:hypothetical protein V9J77_003368 [Vibrio cholerae]|nr:hypothetical protein [Vibrio cholerae]